MTPATVVAATNFFRNALTATISLAVLLSACLTRNAITAAIPLAVIARLYPQLLQFPPAVPQPVLYLQRFQLSSLLLPLRDLTRSAPPAMPRPQ